MLSRSQAVERTAELVAYHDSERERLDVIHDYLNNKQPITWMPSGAPYEVQQLARISRVNVLDLVVSTVVQALFVDGYQSSRLGRNEPVWPIWQANKMDRRQVGVHRGAIAYGASYLTVMPGDTAPVLRGVSPRDLTALYGDDDWPTIALEKRKTAEGKLYRLIDETHVYWVGTEKDSSRLVYISDEEHGLGVVPVVRFLAEEDIDGDIRGEVEPLFSLQDQINITTFGLLVAQHYGAFKQRYILGWLADTEERKLQAQASKLWTFPRDTEHGEVEVGEFSQTDTSGYIEAREASIRHLATMSQTPAHELIGQLVNMSADSIAAAEASYRRKLDTRKTTLGESWEQSLELAARIQGLDTDDEAEVRWRDTEARSFAQTVDGLVKLLPIVPTEALMEHVPLGQSQKDIEHWVELHRRDTPIGAFLDGAMGPIGDDDLDDVA